MWSLPNFVQHSSSKHVCLKINRLRDHDGMKELHGRLASVMLTYIHLGACVISVIHKAQRHRQGIGVQTNVPWNQQDESRKQSLLSLLSTVKSSITEAPRPSSPGKNSMRHSSATLFKAARCPLVVRHKSESIRKPSSTRTHHTRGQLSGLLQVVHACTPGMGWFHGFMGNVRGS